MSLHLRGGFLLICMLGKSVRKREATRYHLSSHGRQWNLEGMLLGYSNHSCNPNAIVQVAPFDMPDGQKDDRLCAVLLAVRHICVGEEVTWHYREDYDWETWFGSGVCVCSQCRP